jgi:hypothetical protein
MVNQSDFQKMLNVLSILRMEKELDDMAAHRLSIAPEHEARVRRLIQELPDYGASPEEFAMAEDQYYDEITMLRSAFPVWLSKLDHHKRSLSALHKAISYDYSCILVGSKEQQEAVWNEASQWREVTRWLQGGVTMKVVNVDASGLTYDQPGGGRDFFARVAQALGIDPDMRNDYLPLAYLKILSQIRGHVYNLTDENHPTEDHRYRSAVEYVFMVEELDPKLGGFIFCNLRDELWNTPGVRWVTRATLEESKFFLRPPLDFFDRQINLATGEIRGANYSR